MKTTIKCAIIAISFAMIGMVHAEQTQSDSAAAVFLANGGEASLNAQLRECEGLSSRVAGICAQKARNAYNYLSAKANSSLLPAQVWNTCSTSWKADMELGARCITAAEDICKINERGQLSDSNDCLSNMSRGRWVRNAKANALRLDEVMKVSDIKVTTIN
jgi:hypothetical protein